MRKRLVGLLALGLIGGSLGIVAPATADPSTTVDFRAIVALSNCSGSVVLPANASMDDPALVLTNGHCYRLMAAGAAVADLPSSRTFSLLNSGGTDTIATLQAQRLLYATMTGTDVALYRLTQTYAQIQSQTGAAPLRLSAAHPVEERDISLVSGYWRRIYDCRIEGFVHSVREYVWTWRDAIRYAAASTCQTVGGTSGSPLIDDLTGAVVGVHNTTNEDGASCTLNNPCEVTRHGAVTVRPQARYGQQTHHISACLGAGNTIDLTRPGCTLTRPA